MKRVLFLLITAIICFSCQFNTMGNVKDYYIVVNKATNCVTVYKTNKEGNYEPYKAMICSVGANNATPSGTFNTKNKYRWRPLFGDVYGQYATRIDGSILFHSVCYKSENPNSLKTEEYNKLGTAVSMGCVRLTVADAKWIYDNCSIGTRVDIIDSGIDPLPRPNAIKMYANASYPNWDPTDSDVNNPWKNEGVKFVYNNINQSIKINYAFSSEKLAEAIREGVTAYDTANNVINYNLAYNIHYAVAGVYEVKYYATDVLGNYGEIIRYITLSY